MALRDMVSASAVAFLAALTVAQPTAAAQPDSRLRLAQNDAQPAAQPAVTDPAVEEFSDAAAAGDLAKVKAMLAGGASVSKPNAKGMLPLSRAAAEDHLDVVQALLAAGADVNGKNLTSNATALLFAAEHNHLDVVRALLAAHADVNARNWVAASPLFYAAARGHTEIVKVLIAAGADVNVRITATSTPLFSAAGNGHTEIVKALIAAGADINAKSNFGGTSGGVVTGMTALHRAAQQGHADVVRVLLAAGAHINEATETSHLTALMIAASNGHSDVVKVLIEAGADINAVGGAGFTAMTTAARNGHQDIVALLQQGRSGAAAGGDAGEGPSLEDTVQFIVAKMSALKPIDATLVLHMLGFDSSGPDANQVIAKLGPTPELRALGTILSVLDPSSPDDTDLRIKLHDEYSNVSRGDAYSCRIVVHFKRSMNDKVSIDNDLGLNFNALQSVQVMTAVQYEARRFNTPKWVVKAVTPEATVLLVTFTAANGKTAEWPIMLTDADMANRLSRAISHAGERCGAKKEPF